MTYRDDDEAAHAHLASETKELERARRERDRLRMELAELTQLRDDLDGAVASRRGSLLSGLGYLRLAALMIAMLAAGAVDDYVRPTHPWAHFVLLGAVMLGMAPAIFFADRRQKAVTKLLEAHDARMAAARKDAEPEAQPSIPNARVADDVATDRADEREAPSSAVSNRIDPG
jgi:hypothetical protein